MRHWRACEALPEEDRFGARVDRASLPAQPEDELLRLSEQREARRILAADLRSDELTVLYLRAVERRTPAEIAAAVQVSDRQYRKLLERAGRKFRDAWERRRDEELLILYAGGLLRGADLERARALAETPAGGRFLAAIERRDLTARLEISVRRRRFAPPRTEGQ